MTVLAPEPVVLTTGRTGRPAPPDDWTRRGFARLALATGLVLVAIGAGAYLAGDRLAERQALADVEGMVQVVSHTALEPHAEALVTGDQVALEALDEVVRAHLLPNTSIRRVKVWDRTGQIIYSDAAALVGESYPLTADQRAVLDRGITTSRVSGLSHRENRLDRPLAPRLLEVYTPVHTHSGPPLLLEAYIDYQVVEQRRSDMLQVFAWVALVGLATLAAGQLALTFSTLRWLRGERAELARRRAQVADSERRRLARDLHDGVVQDLVGASFVTSSAVDALSAAGRNDLAGGLRPAVSAIRGSIQGLRSMLVDLYPASLRATGLSAALPDLLAPVQHRGVEVTLDLPDGLHLPEHVEAVLYRTCQELVRNAVTHGHARRVAVSVAATRTTATLEVTDDGTGFDPAASRAPGHLGLVSVADTVDELGGVLQVSSAPGYGAQFRLTLPLDGPGDLAAER